jgi:hypothetical protein
MSISYTQSDFVVYSAKIVRLLSESPTFPLGRDKTRCLAVRFLIPPFRACDFHRTRRSTFGRSPWTSMKRLFPLLQLHSAFSVDSLRVRWVPLFPSFQRLGAFAISPHPGVPSFPGLRLLCPLRLL